MKLRWYEADSESITADNQTAAGGKDAATDFHLIFLQALGIGRDTKVLFLFLFCQKVTQSQFICNFCDPVGMFAYICL